MTQAHGCRHAPMWQYSRKELTVKLGHVHIKVRDLEEAEAFYTHFFGLKVTERVGSSYSFLSAGEAHHDIALQQVGQDAPLPQRHAVGLFHTAFEVPSKEAFARTYYALKQAGVPVAATDHRISWAMYLSDPSGNGVEIYCDTRAESDNSDVWEGLDRPLNEATISDVFAVAARDTEKNTETFDRRDQATD